LGISSTLDPEPLIFKTEAEFYSYMYDPEYETVNMFQYQENPGICIGILIDENISNENTPLQDQKVRIEILAEATRGKTPSSGSMKNDTTSQQIVPNTGSPSFDKYSKNPDSFNCELYVRQGFSWMQNWAANAALR
jgi:hypothetical protein